MLLPRLWRRVSPERGGSSAAVDRRLGLEPDEGRAEFDVRRSRRSESRRGEAGLRRGFGLEDMAV